MIIIKIIILYFIQIRHSDDFPSTGTRLVMYNSTTVRMPIAVNPSQAVLTDCFFI